MSGTSFTEPRTMPNRPLHARVAVVAADLDGRQPDWGAFFPRKVQEVIERDTPPTDMDFFMVRTRLHQAELDPSTTEEAARLRDWLERHR